LLPGTGGGSYTGNFFSFCCQGQKEEVTQGTFFPFAARDRRRKLHRERAVFCFPFVARDRRRKLHPALQDRQTDRHVAFIYKIR
jgi:hypothetical protein